MECFTDYLEKLSVTRVEEREMAVIIIDGADLIKVRTYMYILCQLSLLLHGWGIMLEWKTENHSDTIPSILPRVVYFSEQGKDS